MKQSLARTLLILSLVLSLASFILSVIALNLPSWKSIQLRSSFVPVIAVDHNPMDPLIRGEVDKYIDSLYRRGETHAFGLLTHCIVGGQCGRNLLPSFDENNYSLCHSINYHRQCIFSQIPSTTDEMKCTCQQPSYVKIMHKLLIVLIALQLIFFVVNLLRVCRRHCVKICCNDIQLRLISLLSSLSSCLFLIVIIIQHNAHRLDEPLEFFESMRRHYSRIQIYTFSKDLETIVEQMESALDVRMGASYICIVLILVFTLVAFLASISVEIKLSSASSSLTFSEEEEKKNHSHYSSAAHNNHSSIDSVMLERFVPSEQIRYTRQTIV